MKLYKSIFIAALTSAILLSAAFAQKQRKTVFIIVDGVAGDVIEKLRPPTLQAIEKEGKYTRAYVGGTKDTYSQSPTISAVGYNSILTGTWANKHNVWDNDIAAPNYNYPTIFRMFKEAFPQKKTAIYSSWQDNRTKLVGDKLAATGNFGVDYSFDGLEHDTVKYPHDKARDFMSNIDDAVAMKAADDIKNIAPDLSWVYLEYTDDMGHMHGDSPEYYNAVNLADKRVGYIWQAIQYRQQHNNEEWMIVVTTDHGRDAETGKDHGGQSERERSSWMCTNVKTNYEFQMPLASVADIVPSIARFMNIPLSAPEAYELDGIPFYGKLSFLFPTFKYLNKNIKIDWRPLESGDLNIFVSTTNNYKTGGKDNYVLLHKAQLKDQKDSLDLPDSPTGFYKIVLQSKNNNYNYWVVPGNKPMGKK